MTYNILEGGVDDKGSRIEHIVSVIKKADPDFVAIQEANNFDKNDNELLKRVSNETKLLHYALARGTLYGDQKRYHVVSLSRYPLQGVYLFPGSLFQSAALFVVINSPFGELSLCNVHLHSSSEDERLREARVVLGYQSNYKKHIILGDFNALSRSDHYGDLSAQEFTSYDLARFETTDMFNRDYVDVTAHLNVNDRSTYPTIGVSHKVSKSPIRIDYIFVTPSLSAHIKNVEVVKTQTAEKASDHYPVVVTLK